MATDIRTDVGSAKSISTIFATTEKYVFKSPQGARRRHRRRDLGDEERARLDARLPAEEPGDLQLQADAAAGAAISSINFQDIYLLPQAHRPSGRSPGTTCPTEIKNTFDKLGIPEAEKKFLAGVKAQYESEVVYGSLKEDLSRQGVIFTDTDSAVREHPDLVREYFGTIIPPTDNKFAALNSAVWSGGSFIYVPPGGEDRVPACRPISASMRPTWASSSGR